jgi:murein DD-endopeptidase MepM/ murein hydrolase activator NlpD
LRNIVARKNFGTSTITHRFDAIMARIAPYAAAASAALILWHAARDTPALVVSAPAPLVYPTSAAAGTPPLAAPAVMSAAATVVGAPLATQQAGFASTIEVIVGRNDTMDAIFRRMALDKADLAAIRDLPGIRQSLDFLKPGDSIKVTHTNDGEVKELSRKVSETQTLKVVREDAGFAAKIISNPVETRIRTATATIDSSLFQAAAAADISDVVALKLANVFAWDIDFVLDIRAGDRFTAVYEQIYQDGKYLRDGEVLAAEFVNSGKVYRAVRFAADGGTASYYTPDGKPMRKAFLRAPVDFTRVSSVFNPARMHPILNRIRGHMGTDYAAPTGTPIHAAGDGRVSFEGTRGGYGNAIVLLHSNNVSTLYGHMSRFAKNIRLGSHVNQGDVIGYVGMTGLATGPHLHYEYLMNGVHMDPQTVRLPGAEPLRAESLGAFRSTAAPLLSRLEAPASDPAASTTASISAAGAPPAAVTSSLFKGGAAASP